MRIVFAGTPEPAVPALRKLIESPRHDVVGVLTRPDAVAGRGRRVTRSPIGELADAEGIEVIAPRSLRDEDAVAALQRLAPDCCPVVAYGGLVPPNLLALPPHGWINLHFSLLPAWRGAAPVQAAIAAGDEVTGASTFRIEEGLDTGPVYGMVTETISDKDTAGDLLGRLAESGALLLSSTLDAVEDGAVTAVPQPTDGVSLAPKVTVPQAQVRWDRPAHIVDRHVRAMTPAPGAWTELAGARVKIGRVRVVDAGQLAPGAISADKTRVLVGTHTDPLLLSTVQPQGKREMPAADWARGARIDGQVFG